MYPGHWAQQKPDAPAVIHSVTDERLSWRELDDRSNQLAQLLRAAGLRRGDHLSLYMENRLDFFVVAWAAMRSGLYYTPISRYLTADEAGYILRDSGAKALVTSVSMDTAPELVAQAPDCTVRLSSGGAIEGFRDLAEALAEWPAEPLAEQPAGSSMPYSSGTTGRPKGVSRPLPECAVDDPALAPGALQAGIWGFDDNTIYLSPAPLYHTAPYGFCMATLSLGGTVVMMPRFDAEGALAAIERYGVTHSQWVPTMFSRMLKLEGDRDRFDLSTMKVAIHAAAPCPPQVKQQMLDWWGDVIYEYYAGSELNGFTHVTPQEWRAHPGTVGRSLLGVIRICDEDGKELPQGEAGLVYFEQEATGFSYHNDPEKTRSSRHPVHDNWSALGDVGYVDEDGFLYLTDRATFMIISGGVNIYPREIEDVLVLHPSVADVAVIGVPNEEMGEEVKAVVQVEAGVTADDALAGELIEHCRASLAHFKCPRSVDFMDQLPRSDAGKLFKRRIKDLYWPAKA